uniref:Uncharacterized protein n=1 Tax=Arundo donax TaxID=35708 RepID=A0A0A8YW65_ARUDO
MASTIPAGIFCTRVRVPY